MSEIILKEGSTPSTPASGQVSLYAKDGGLPFIKNDGGIEKPINIGYENNYSLLAKIGRDARLINHFSGLPHPNITFNPNGHLGQVPISNTGVYGGDGKFGKGATFLPPATNLVMNPSFETNTTYWSSAGTNIVSRSSEQSKFGSYSLKYEYKDSSYGGRLAITVPSAGVYTFAFWFYKPASYSVQDLRAFFSFPGAAFDNVQIDNSKRDQWQLVTGTATIVAGSLTGELLIGFNYATPVVGDYFYIDGVLVVAGSSLYNYFDGSFPNCSWSGTAHGSTSSISSQSKIEIAKSEIPTSGTIMFWMYLNDFTVGKFDFILGQKGTVGTYNLYARFYGDSDFAWRWGTASPSVNTSSLGLFPRTWTHIAMTRSANGTLSLFINGVLDNSINGGDFVAMDNVYLGSYISNATYSFNGSVDDFAIINRVLTTDEIKAVYESDVPLMHFE